MYRANGSSKSSKKSAPSIRLPRPSGRSSKSGSGLIWAMYFHFIAEDPVFYGFAEDEELPSRKT